MSKARIRYSLDFCLIGLLLLIVGFLFDQIAIRLQITFNSKWSALDIGLVLLAALMLLMIMAVLTQRHSGRQLSQREEFTELQQKYHKLLYSYMNLEEKYAQSYTVQLILEEISRELDSDRLFKKTTDIIMGVFGSKKCIIYMADTNKNLLVARASSEFNGGLPDEASISLSSQNIIAGAWRDRRVYTETDTKQPEMAELQRRSVNSILAIPLTGLQDCLGIMVIEHELKTGLSPDLVEFAKLITQELSLSVENAYLYDRMRQMANHDALTGIYNRKYLINYVADIFNQKPKIVSLIMFDMDFFKRINDRYGHLSGDLVLQTTTAIVQKILPTGILARYGGEEFVIAGCNISRGVGHLRQVRFNCRPEITLFKLAPNWSPPNKGFNRSRGVVRRRG